jgi:hypothetical protein
VIKVKDEFDKACQEDFTFSDAIELLLMIEKKKMTLKDLRAEVSESVISIFKFLEWIGAENDDSEIMIASQAWGYMAEHKAMIDHSMQVLENVKKAMNITDEKKGMIKVSLENNATAQVVEFLKKKEFISFKKTGLEYPDDFVSRVTEKGGKELKEYFNNGV